MTDEEFDADVIAEPTQVDQVRNRLVSLGVDAEWINDQVMALGGQNFIAATRSFANRVDNAERVYQAGEVATVGRLIQFETFLDILGIDSEDPHVSLRTVSLLHHLVEHAANDGCGIANEILERMNVTRSQ